MAAAVFDAVDALLVESGPGRFTVTDIARRAGINATSIYRRWGSLEAVILDRESARLDDLSPLPNTGTLRGDLLAYAHTAADDIRKPGRLAFLQALVGASDLDDDRRMAPLLRRAEQFQDMLNRARDRGESALDYTVVVDCILAPIYLRHLTGRGLDAADIEVFVDRALASAGPPAIAPG
ncbi:TetR/AcrR family transcriptional regulator [Mycobacterium sp. 1245801.1]|uniref:TetR/AcrR family transcriptional regulator n=1 Tax=Mycobacterium sp. 1245801.1 TaxID=1834075 RepID=UPI001E3D5ED3|nr:TetR/AcrR family transcriptional regulator [Mycobacterium sp. 1245801.1]